MSSPHPGSPTSAHVPQVSAPSVADVLAHVRRAGLELEALATEFDESGLAFRVLHAQGRDGAPWIVRTPRRPSELDSARIEARTLALVAPRLPVQVPNWQIFTEEVIAYRRLEGTPAISIDPLRGPRWNILDPTAPSAVFLESTGAALAALHSVPLDAAHAAGVSLVSLDAERETLASAMRETRAVLSPSPATWQRWLAYVEDDTAWVHPIALCHGDFHPGHWLLDATGRLTGILDWTTAGVADPGFDFALVYGCLGDSGTSALIAHYERAGGTTWPRLLEHARERWAIFPVTAASFALSTDNQGVLEHSRGLLRGVEPAPSEGS